MFLKWQGFQRLGKIDPILILLQKFLANVAYAQVVAKTFYGMAKGPSRLTNIDHDFSTIPTISFRSTYC